MKCSSMKANFDTKKKKNKVYTPTKKKSIPLDYATKHAIIHVSCVMDEEGTKVSINV